MGKPGTPRQDRAVIREYEDALEAGAYDLAYRIAEANPDLAAPFHRALDRHCEGPK